MTFKTIASTIEGMAAYVRKCTLPKYSRMGEIPNWDRLVEEATKLDALIKEVSLSRVQKERESSGGFSHRFRKQAKKDLWLTTDRLLISSCRPVQEFIDINNGKGNLQALPTIEIFEKFRLQLLDVANKLASHQEDHYTDETLLHIRRL